MRRDGRGWSRTRPGKNGGSLEEMTEMPSRREFLKTAAGGALAAHATAQTARKPNLLFIFSDQHRACSMPGEPFNDAAAPNLARLAREGLTARNCISNYPVCSPYRGMLLSGRWPYQTGIIDNAHPLKECGDVAGRDLPPQWLPDRLHRQMAPGRARRQRSRVASAGVAARV